MVLECTPVTGQRSVSGLRSSAPSGCSRASSVISAWRGALMAVRFKKRCYSTLRGL
jgi:hypothetical protein